MSEPTVTVTNEVTFQGLTIWCGVVARLRSVADLLENVPTEVTR